MTVLTLPFLRQSPASAQSVGGRFSNQRSAEGGWEITLRYENGLGASVPPEPGGIVGQRAPLPLFRNWQAGLKPATTIGQLRPNRGQRLDLGIEASPRLQQTGRGQRKITWGENEEASLSTGLSETDKPL
jgi:hypothetical protein